MAWSCIREGHGSGWGAYKCAFRGFLCWHSEDFGVWGIVVEAELWCAASASAGGGVLLLLRLWGLPQVWLGVVSGSQIRGWRADFWCLLQRWRSVLSQSCSKIRHIHLEILTLEWDVFWAVFLFLFVTLILPWAAVACGSSSGGVGGGVLGLAGVMHCVLGSFGHGFSPVPPMTPVLGFLQSGSGLSHFVLSGLSPLLVCGSQVGAGSTEMCRSTVDSDRTPLRNDIFNPIRLGGGTLCPPSTGFCLAVPKRFAVG